MISSVLKLSFSFFWKGVRNAAHSTSRFHPDRAAGGHCNHRCTGGVAPAGGAGGARGGTANELREQPEADRAGTGQLRERDGGPPARVDRRRFGVQGGDLV